MRPRRLLALLFVTGMFAAGCGVGLHNAIDQEHATPYLANASLGPIGVRAVRVILVASAPTSSSAPQAYLLASLVNQSDTADALTSATVAGGATQEIGGTASGPIDMPAQRVIQLGEPDLGLTGPVLGVGALASPLQVGTTVLVTFTFQNAGTTTLQVPVIDASSAGTTASAAPVSAGG